MTSIQQSKFFVAMTATILALAISGCRKDPVIPVNIEISKDNSFDACKGSYEKYSTPEFFKNETAIIQGAGQPQYIPMQEFVNCEPIFNPNNPYEIVYCRLSQSPPIMAKELWKFNFCTGEKTKIADNFYYYLDYSTTGWLLYTGSGHQVYKIKDDGDSLTALTSMAGYNRAGKWSPDGTKYYYTRDQGLWVYDIHDSLLFSKAVNAYSPIEWIDNSHLLLNGYWSTAGFYSLDIKNGQAISISSQEWHGVPVYGHVYDRKHNIVYFPHLSTSDGRYFMKYDLNNNTVDTIREVTNGYVYKRGSYSPYLNKIITTLLRRENVDGGVVYVNFWNDLLLMNTDGTEERLITLPE